jgi:hypothetical protein
MVRSPRADLSPTPLYRGPCIKASAIAPAASRYSPRSAAPHASLVLLGRSSAAKPLTKDAISAISKSWKSSPREGSSLYRLVGDFVSEDYLLVVSLVKVFVAIAHQFRSPGVGGGGERSPSKGLRIAVVSAAALLPSVTAELRSNKKLLLSVPFYL